MSRIPMMRNNVPVPSAAPGMTGAIKKNNNLLKFKQFIKLAVVIAVGVWFYSSGNFQKTMSYFAIDANPPVEATAPTSTAGFEKSDLLDLIDEQSRLADAIIEARNHNDREELKRLFAEFEGLEADFQKEFSKANPDLTASEANEISRSHRDIMRKLN